MIYSGGFWSKKELKIPVEYTRKKSSRKTNTIKE